MSLLRAWLLVSTLLSSVALGDELLTVAVASNFQTTAKDIATEFTAQTGIPVRISTGSSGKLYAQIVNGAPYDVFLSADAARPQQLEASRHAKPGSRATYAIGSLVLWSADPALQGRGCRDALQQREYTHLAIANPKTAPYGAAAEEFLQGAGLMQAAAGRLVFGENISQVLNFVVTGNATLGLVAASQVASELPVSASCSWRVPSDRHSAILQQAVTIAGSSNIESANLFMSFLQSDEARALLERHGYGVPD